MKVSQSQRSHHLKVTRRDKKIQYDWRHLLMSFLIGVGVFATIVMIFGTIVYTQQHAINEYCAKQPDATPICISTFTRQEVWCGECIWGNVTCTDTIIRWENCNVTVVNG
jgi:hypothetical protein